MKRIVFILLLIVSTQTMALPTVFDAASRLSFSAPTENADGTPLIDLAGFKVYWNTTDGGYTDLNSQYFADPTITEILLQDIVIPEGGYYFVLTAVNTGGNESAFSNSGVAKKIGGKWYKSLNAGTVPGAPFNMTPE